MKRLSDYVQLCTWSIAETPGELMRDGRYGGPARYVDTSAKLTVEFTCYTRTNAERLVRAIAERLEE